MLVLHVHLNALNENIYRSFPSRLSDCFISRHKMAACVSLKKEISLWQLNLNQTGWHRRVRTVSLSPTCVWFSVCLLLVRKCFNPWCTCECRWFHQVRNMTSEDLLVRFQGLNDAFITLRCIYFVRCIQFTSCMNLIRMLLTSDAGLGQIRLIVFSLCQKTWL